MSTDWRFAISVESFQNIHIPKDKNVLFNGANRPISILPVLGKIIEKIVSRQMQSYFVENGLFTKFEHAYNPIYSTATALVHKIDSWYQDLDDGKEFRAI